MRTYCTILITVFVVFSNVIHAKSDSISLKSAVNSMNDYLLKRDTAQLKTLITNTVTYGHSNGWIQDSRTLLTDLYNGKLTYSIINQKITNIVLENNIASVRANAAVEGKVDGNTFTMNLHVLQVWIDTGEEGWKLMARQSTKIL
jgi:hypothetical protein